jgi:lipopolysaccharide transport system ATP-binding protein
MTALVTLKDVSMHFATESNRDYAVFGGINFSISAGERVAVIGRNGSGKSTLLRVMARIFAPSSGSVEWAPGVSVSMLSLGLGFRSDLTGRDNALLSCMLLGLSRKEAKASVKHIEAFCEIGAFFDEPVYTYSAGMRARLGFGSALMNRSQVILIDETLSVGDTFFRDKAREALQEKLTEDRAVVLVTHGEQQVRRLCARAVLLEGGTMLADGAPDEVLAEYAALAAP